MRLTTSNCSSAVYFLFGQNEICSRTASGGRSLFSKDDPSFPISASKFSFSVPPPLLQWYSPLRGGDNNPSEYVYFAHALYPLNAVVLLVVGFLFPCYLFYISISFRRRWTFSLTPPVSPWPTLASDRSK